MRTAGILTAGLLWGLSGSLVVTGGSAGQASAPVTRFSFDGSLADTGSAPQTMSGGTSGYVRGVLGEALKVGPGDQLAADPGVFPPSDAESYSVQYWMRTTAAADRRFAVLSQKQFADNSLTSQKQPGWVFYASDGTWAWSLGAGDRRITYERDNGSHMPVNDGRWHQLTMTYDAARAEVRLYYDGRNRAIYNVADNAGFEFASDEPLTIGSSGTTATPAAEILPAIDAGAETLQQYVDAFNAFGLAPVSPEEFVRLIVEPEQLFDDKVDARAATLGDTAESFRESMAAVDFEAVSELEAALMRNPYTIHQAFSFMEAAPLLKIYSLVDDRVVVDNDTARRFTERERLHPAEFDIDELAVWNRALSAAEIRNSYAEHFEPAIPAPAQQIDSITAGVWNIFHGGKHFTVDEHGWDSRLAIAQIIEREGIDVVMMQETYSSGDFIAAELGFYFATTVDRDYLNQGANISVLSRFPIEEIYVEGDSAFMNVGARVAVSETQDAYVMSNWYGMQQFPAVFAFHQERFAESGDIPVLFGGDFNAVPHTDGGDSPASVEMLTAGFTDAFRDTFPDVDRFPGPTHRNGRRIDQLYYKGETLTNTSTRLIDTWPTGFPSDHKLIRSTFDLR